MGLVLNKVYDPRDSLQKTRRKPLENYMKANFPQMFQPGMPADLMRMILRQHGVSRIETPQEITRPAEPDRSVDALALLAQEWTPFDETMKIGDLRRACKERGIKVSPKYRKPDLVRLLNGQDPSERHE